MTAYLDNAASTRLRPEVIEAMLAAARECAGNPSSIHSPGRRSRRWIEDARELIADKLRVPPRGVIFTSGATEANNLVLFGTAPRRLATSVVEHESILRSAKTNFEVEWLPVDAGGRVAPRDVRGADLISVMLANNEVGTIQPLAEIAARSGGAIVHADAVQAFGRWGWDVPSLGVDLVSISAHKIHGPKGIGALAARDPLRLPSRPMIYGGAQEFEKRAGTENVVGISGFAKAVELAFRDMGAMQDRVARLRDRLERGLIERIPGSRVNGDPMHRAAHITNVRFDGVDGESLAMALDARGISVSAGAACAALGTEPSHVLAAMGLSPPAVKGSIRFSLALDTTEAEIEETLKAVPEAVEGLRKKK